MTTNNMCVTWSGRHKYEARYDETPSNLQMPWLVTCDIKPKAYRELAIRRVYVCDVCRYCGDVIEREAP